MTTEVTEKLAAQAFDSMWMDGGFTFLLGDNGEPFIPTHGYVTSVDTNQRVLKKEAPFEVFWGGLQDVLDAYTEAGAAGIGGWVHEDHVHLDPVAVYADKGEALSVAKIAEQLAIYDVEHDVVITVEQEGD